ncbi:MAG: molybdopterin-dependent oxidoreductase [Micromonosporaceae bacterium]
MRDWRIAALASGVAGLGAGELIAAWVRPDASPFVAVADATVDLTPTGVKDLAIALLGPLDKVVLLVGVAAVLLACAYGIARLGQRSVTAAVVGIAVLCGIGLLAAVTRPGAGVTYAVPSVVAGVVACGVFAKLASLLPAAAEDTEPEPSASPASHEIPDGDAPDGDVPGEPAPDADVDPATGGESGPVDGEDGPVGAEDGGYDRRRFLVASGLAGVGAVAAAGLGRWLVYDRFGAARSRAALTVPRPDSTAAGAVDDLGAEVPGLSRFHTSNRDFYRVDTALTVPQLRADEWQLKIHGMVDRPLMINYEQLVSRPLIERDITIACVSNQVGGPYVGNARWIGVPLKEVLEEAGVRAGADQVVSRSHDGMTIGTPTAALTDGRDAMLAVAMNGELLPIAHGFPVRMVVPGLYGYVSATKWVVELELTTFQAYDAYWIKQGWAQQAEVKTASRIDTPRKDPRAGEVMVAGVAWAQHRGIRRVEVQVDDGPWQDAELAEATSVDTWRQWRYPWQATPGTHRLRVRATDGDGQRQTDRKQSSFPDGATGWHEVEVSVSA